MKKTFLTALLLSLALGTAACDKAAKLIDDAGQNLKDGLQAAQDDMVQKSGANMGEVKNNYVSCLNRINGMTNLSGSVEKLLDKYKRQKLSEATAKKRNPDVYYSTNAIKSCTEDITKANKTTFPAGKYDELAKTGKVFEEKLVAFNKTLSELDIYLSSKAYMDDDFQKGREFDPVFIKQAEEFNQAYNDVNTAFNNLELITNQEQVASLKKSGQMRRAYAYEAYANIHAFLTTYEQSQNPTDEAVVEKLNGYLKATIDAVNNLKTENEKKKDDKSSKLERAHGDLNEIVGEMREAKSKNYRASAVQDVFEKYNRFVKFTLNMGQGL